MNDDKTILEIARRAIDDNRSDEARSLLNPLMRRNVTEAFFLASKVAKTQEQVLKFLRHALKLDPDNMRVKNHLFQLEMLYENDGIVTISDLVDHPRIMPSSSIEETVALFEKYSWEIVAQRDNYAQFIRRPTMSIINAFCSGLFFHILGSIWLIITFITSEKIHASAENDGNGLILTTVKGQARIAYPEQSILYLEKIQGSSFLPSLLYNLLGVIIITMLIGFFIWQSDFFLETLSLDTLKQAR